MAKVVRSLLVATLLLGAALAGSLAPVASYAAASLGTFAVNYDGTRGTKYRNGDKPVAGCSAPSGWTVASKGTGFGEICGISATEFDFSAGGDSATNGFRYAYKDVASGDFQLKMRVTNEYAPTTLGNFAGIGITISDGTADADAVHNVFSPLSAAAVARSLAGTPGSTTNVNGASGQSRPRYLCAAYDESETESRVFESADGSTWLAIATFDYAFSTPIVGIYDNSGSSTDTLSATADNIELRTGASAINCYTPAPPPGGAPELISPIGSQSGTQGVAFSLDCDDNWTGQTPLTHPYTISGLAVGTNLSFDGESCLLTGTPDADDVGTRNVTITAKNASGDTPDTFSLTIAAAGGDVFEIQTGDASANFASTSLYSGGPTWVTRRISGSGTRPQDGDTVIIRGGASGVRGPLVINNPTGTESSPVRITNDPDDNDALNIRKTTNGGFVLQVVNSTWATLEGVDWAGGTQDCGYDPDTQSEGTSCGFRVTATAGHPTTYLQFSTFVTGLTVCGIEMDGSAASGGGSGILMQLNSPLLNADNPGVWRQDITIGCPGNGNYLHNSVGTDGEGMYIGPNGYDEELPLRRVTIQNNLVRNTARNGIELKYALDGPNFITGNKVDSPGLSGEAGQLGGISVIDGGDVTIDSNIVLDAPGPGITCNNQTAVNTGPGTEPFTDPFYCTMQNNIVVRSGSGCFVFAVGAENQAGTNKDGVKIQVTPALVQNGTCIDAGGAWASFNSNMTGSRIARDSIRAGTGGSVSGGTSTNNRQDTIANLKFVAAGSDNYELAADSPACNQATTNAPADDYEGESRPQDSADDQGADESALCP